MTSYRGLALLVVGTVVVMSMLLGALIVDAVLVVEVVATVEHSTCGHR